MTTRPEIPGGFPLERGDMTTLLICLAAVIIAYYSGKKKGLELGRQGGNRYVVEIKRKD